MEQVVQTVQNRQPKGLVFHLAYKIAPGGETIGHEIECDANAPTTLVISMAGAINDVSNFVSITVGPDDRREWFCHRIVYAKFGYRP